MAETPDTSNAAPVATALARARRIVLLAAGKAAAPMARAAIGVLRSRIHRGLVVTKNGHGRNRLAGTIPGRIRVREAAHPEPDGRGLAAAREAMALARGCRPDELLLVLLSGGASALLPLPIAGLSLADKRRTTRLLLRSGLAIKGINAVRKHLSAIKGGGLLRACPAGTVVTLIVSDVIGNDIAAIGSGPTAPDPTRFAQARAFLAKAGVGNRVPAGVRSILARGEAGLLPETLKPGEPTNAHVYNVVVADLSSALDGAAAEAARRGYRVIRLADPVRGEARDAGRVLARRLMRIARPAPPAPLSHSERHAHPAHPARHPSHALRSRRSRPSRPSHPVAPLAMIAGGEPTVTVHGRGRGGRAMELVLAATMALEGLQGALVAGIGTDGTDGPTRVAGALASERTLRRARALGLDPARALSTNDTLTFFERAGGAIVTGPTGTNVGDVYLFLAGGAHRDGERS